MTQATQATQQGELKFLRVIHSFGRQIAVVQLVEVGTGAVLHDGSLAKALTFAAENGVMIVNSQDILTIMVAKLGFGA